MSKSQNIRFANFRLDHLIGSGGFARVYLGWEGDSDTPLAIKIIDANFWCNEYGLDSISTGSTIAAAMEL